MHDSFVFKFAGWWKISTLFRSVPHFHSTLKICHSVMIEYCFLFPLCACGDVTIPLITSIFAVLLFFQLMATQYFVAHNLLPKLKTFFNFLCDLSVLLKPWDRGSGFPYIMHNVVSELYTLFYFHKCCYRLFYKCFYRHIIYITTLLSTALTVGLSFNQLFLRFYKVDRVGHLCSTDFVS